MTTQTAIFDGLPTGLSLSAKIFDTDAPDTEVTVDDVDINEGANAKGRYALDITDATALTGDYDIRLFIGSAPLAVGTFRFSGTDGETAIEVPVTAALDSAITTQLGDIETDVAASVGYLTSLSGIFTGITSLANWLRRGFRKDSGTAGMATAETEINTGGTATFIGTTDSLEAIRDASGGSGGGTATLEKQEEILEEIRTYASSMLATVDGSAATIVGFPETLVIGDSYTTDGSNAIHVFVRDSNDDPVTAVGTHEFTDSDFAPEVIITTSGRAGRVRASVTWVPGGSEGYLKIQIPLSESHRAAPGAATVQVVLKWTGCEKTIATQTVTWIPRI